MDILYRSARPAIEAALLASLSPEVPWALVERFSTLVRESGSEDEREAARYIVSRLSDLGIPHRVYEPELFLSVPVSAAVEAGGERFRAKPPSFSASTGPAGVSGELVYVPAASSLGWREDLFRLESVLLFPEASPPDPHVRGKIVLTEGFGFEEDVAYFERQGAIGQIYINPGERIHWGICTTIWGAPDLDMAARQPRTPVVVVNRSSGDQLQAMASQGSARVTIYAELKEGWVACPLIVAEITGAEEPERFMLIHGHYDSWGVGVGDNAVGDAALLELARVFHRHRDGLARSLKVAWWPGHSTGRYAGSTWFADTFGLELARHCIAQVNVDSPGCRWATEYRDVSWMSEAEGLCVQAIRDATGQPASGGRPPQAGDYSFNNLGICGFFMLLSSMPRVLAEEKGYYAVGGCGGNVGWHSEEDTLELADRDNLMRDLRVYVTAVQRVLNNPVLPLDLRALVGELHATLDRYAASAGAAVDFAPALTAADALQEQLDRLYRNVPMLVSRPVTDPAVRAFNDAVLEMERILIPINYTRRGRFRTEPAIIIPPLPDLAPALDLGAATGHYRQVLCTHLRRGVNRVAWALERAAEIARATAAGLS